MSKRSDIYSERTFYRRNESKSFLVIRSSEEPELPYQINMIRYNRIPGLLPVQFFIEDGEYQYFYDITCKESLEEKMKQKKYTIREIRTIMSDLYRCVQSMEDYLLDIDCLILEPEYLFSEKEKLDIHFCFYQDKKESFEISLGKLFDYFLNQLDYQDEKTVLLVYSLYQRSKEDHTSLKELMKEFCNVKDQETDSVQPKQHKEETEKWEKTEQKAYEWNDREEEKYEKFEKYEQFENGVRNPEKKRSLRNDSKYSVLGQSKIKRKADKSEKNGTALTHLIPYIPDLIGGIVIAVILWYISRNHMQMSGKEFLLWMIGIAIILALSGLLATFFSELMQQVSDQEKYHEEDHEEDPFQAELDSEESKSEGRTGDKTESRTGGGSEYRTEYGTESRTGGGTEYGTESRTRGGSEYRTEYGTESRTGGGTEYRTEYKTGAGLEDRFYGRPEQDREKRTGEKYKRTGESNWKDSERESTGEWKQNGYGNISGNRTVEKNGEETGERKIKKNRQEEADDRDKKDDHVFEELSFEERWNSEREEKTERAERTESEDTVLWKTDTQDSIIAIQSLPATVIMNEPELFRGVNPVLISKDKEKYQDVILKDRTMVVGKVRGIADVFLDGKNISRIHARINQDDRGCSITDMGSTNGTYVNGMRIKEQQKIYLKDGDIVRFAKAEYEYHSDGVENVHSHRTAGVI